MLLGAFGLLYIQALMLLKTIGYTHTDRIKNFHRSSQTGCLMVNAGVHMKTIQEFNTIWENKACS